MVEAPGEGGKAGMAFIGSGLLSLRRSSTKSSVGSNGAVCTGSCRRSVVRCVAANVDTTLSRVGSAELDWAEMGFSYVQTNCFVQCVYKDGEWGELELVKDPYIRIHIGATALHYGQSCFEGLKAFTGKDGRVRLFRPDENAARLERSAERIVMQKVPKDMFLKACKMAVRENIEFVPPYGFGGSLYVRPLLFGSGARVGLQPADEYTFLVMVTPVGDYYKGGVAPVTALVQTAFDRAAPRGIGNVKVGGNYAADMLPFSICKAQGYPINLYLDAATQSTVEEFGTSNFIALKGNSFVTPDSESVLPSITNKTLMALAEDMGLKVEKRPIPLSELSEMDEVAACGTAVVITPVTRLVLNDKVLKVGKNPDSVGPVFAKLYKRVRAIQNAEEEDRFGWTFDVMQ